jgi:2-hydroxy-6-oxonona-2,4-dienedioate hydrolase
MQRRTLIIKEVRDGDTTLRNVSTSYVEAGEGEPVILLHGGCVGGSAADTWCDTIAGLADRYHLIGLDLLWSGYTDKPVVPVTLPLQAAHVAAFIHTLGFPSVKLVGQSVGAYMAARFACDYQDQVTRLVMISSNTVALAMDVAFETHAPDADQPVDERDRQRRLARRLYFRPELITEELVDSRTAINSLPGIPEARASWASYSAKLLARDAKSFSAFELRERLPALDTPSLLIWGKEDRFAPASIGRDLAPLLPRVEYVEVEDGGHHVFRDQAPRVNAMLRRFFTDA